MGIPGWRRRVVRTREERNWTSFRNKRQFTVDDENEAIREEP
jgi:hypothetical protein